MGKLFITSIVLAASVSTGWAALVGYGTGIGSGVDSPGSRLNVDEKYTTLPAGRYAITDFGVNAGNTDGAATPLLARLTAASTYQTLWVGPAFTPAATGVQTATYAPGTQYIHLWTATNVYGGFSQNSNIVRLDDPGPAGNTDHSSSYTPPTAAGQTLSGFSNPDLARNYGFGINVQPAAQPEQIYVETFGGLAANNLAGKVPDVRPGQETWTAGAAIKQDGSKTAAGTNSAWLPFVPQPGFLYSLSMDVNPSISTSSDWFALGFSSNNGTGNFHDGPNSGSAWILNRMDDASTSAFQTFLGPSTNFGASHDPNPNLVGWLKMQILLDTRPSLWTVQWLVNGEILRGPVAYGSNPTINYVGFAGYSNAVGMFDNFVLETIPEPASLAMLGLALGGLGRYLRRRRA